MLGVKKRAVEIAKQLENDGGAVKTPVNLTNAYDRALDRR